MKELSAFHTFGHFASRLIIHIVLIMSKIGVTKILEFDWWYKIEYTTLATRIFIILTFIKGNMRRDSNPSWRSRRCSPTCPAANLFSIAFRFTSKDFPKSTRSNPKGKYHKDIQNIRDWFHDRSKLYDLGWSLLLGKVVYLDRVFINTAHLHES